MSSVAIEALKTAWRDYVTDGVPSSGANEPSKTEIRSGLTSLGVELGNITLGGIVNVVKETRALLNADLAYAANSVALVYGDTTDDNNDFYVKVGASGSGSWTLTTIIHDTLENVAQPYVDLAQAWAEGTLPGGAGTKSSEEWAGVSEDWAGVSEDWADAAELSASTAESVSGPTYASTAAGIAATTVGDSFAVDNGDGTVSIYLHEAGPVATLQRTLATTDALAAIGGDDLIGSDDGASGSLWTTVKGFITYIRALVAVKANTADVLAKASNLSDVANSSTARGNIGAASAENPALTGTIDLNGSTRGATVAVAASAINCATGNYFSKTATGALTWTVSNVPTSRAYHFILKLTNGGLGAQTWMTGIKWPSGTAPTLTSAGVDYLGFITDDGGTTWHGCLLRKDSK